MKKTFFLITLAALMGCQNSHQKSVDTIVTEKGDSLISLTIDGNKIPGYPLDSLVDDVKFVRLQTDDNYLIGNINQFICTGERIFIMDREIANAVYCFDMQGRFLTQYGSTGDGPYEYIRLCNMALSTDKKRLIIADWAGKLLYYDFAGNVVKTSRIPFDKFSFNMIEVIGKDTIVGFTDEGMAIEENKPMLTVAETDHWNILYRTLPSYQTALFHLCNGMFPLRKFGDELYLKKPWTESFYKVNKNNCSQVLHLDIEGGGYPEITDDINGDTYVELLNRTITLNDYFFGKDISMFLFSVPNSWKRLVTYSHKDGTLRQFNGSYTNPLFNFYSAKNTPLVRHADDTYVVQYSASDVLSKKKRIYNDPLIMDKDLEKLYDNLKEDDNPILFFYHLKN